MPTKTRSRKRKVPALGYATAPAGASLDGPEVEVQRRTIEDACRRLGIELVDLIRDQEPDGSGETARPGLLYALERMDAGSASCLVVSDLVRLGGQAAELAAVLDRLDAGDNRLVALDVGLDTETATGRLAVTHRPGVSPTGTVATPPAAPAQPEEPSTLPALHPEHPPQAPATATARPSATARALGYASIPAGDDPTGDLEAQKDAIESACARLGFELVEVVREREPKAGKALDRAGLAHLIGRLAAGDASCLIVNGLDRLSHSVAELGTLVQWLVENRVRLVAVELDLDTSSDGGRAAALALASVGDWERERLADRTRKGLAAARAKRQHANAATDRWVVLRKRIAMMRADGMTLQAIADVLNEEGVPTPRGGAKWRPSSVQTAA
ncbi:MAG: recombinase family protein, partial [Thermoleophilaceae bacterium]